MPVSMQISVFWVLIMSQNDDGAYVEILSNVTRIMRCSVLLAFFEHGDH